MRRSLTPVARTCSVLTGAHSILSYLPLTATSPSTRRSVHFSASSSSSPPRHILKISDLSRPEIVRILQLADDMKQSPHDYVSTLSHHTLLMFFDKPSLRTRLSFETGMTQLGGHAIYYPLDANSTLGAKESIEDVSRVSSRFADLIMMRLKSRDQLRAFAQYATVPVINALDDYAHPCQILADFLTIFHCKHITHKQHWTHLHKKANKQTSPGDLMDAYDLFGMKIAYVGDVANNVTYDLMRMSALFGCEIRVCGPIHQHASFHPEQSVLDECQQLNRISGGRLILTDSITQAVRDAEVIVTDTWHSYHLSPNDLQQRIEVFSPYRVTVDVMNQAHPHALFLHCLPAKRGMEVEADVIDGRWSVVYDEAENRLHAQKALMSFLLDKHIQ